MHTCPLNQRLAQGNAHHTWVQFQRYRAVACRQSVRRAVPCSRSQGLESPDSVTPAEALCCAVRHCSIGLSYPGAFCAGYDRCWICGISCLFSGSKAGCVAGTTCLTGPCCSACTVTAAYGNRSAVRALTVHIRAMSALPADMDGWWHMQGNALHSGAAPVPPRQ